MGPGAGENRQNGLECSRHSTTPVDRGGSVQLIYAEEEGFYGKT